MAAVTLILGRIVQPPSVFAGVGHVDCEGSSGQPVGVPEKSSWGVLWCLTV